jgi:pre-mRNA-splicing helicase BRR2
MWEAEAEAARDERSCCVLMSQQTRREFYKKFLGEGLPIESHLPTHLRHNYFLAEIAVKTIENKQDAMVIFSTFFHSLAQRMCRIF